MVSFEKVYAKLKHVPEDFVVEEIGPKWVCSANWTVEQQIVIPPKPEGNDYLCFEMVKRDIDHFIAVKTLAKELGKTLQFVSYAGSKDKRAVTSQRISIFQPDVEKVENFKSDFIKLKNFSWSKRKIKLGYLEGNHFKVTLRDVDKKDASKIVSVIRKKSFFPNHFGPQRFGSVRKNNDLVGKLILKKDFESAVNMILMDDCADEKPDIRAARKTLREKKNFKEALNYFPPNLRLERGLLLSLSRHNDFLRALKGVEKRYLLLVVQAVQSKLFNEILNQALEEGITFKEEGLQNIPLIGYKTNVSRGRLGEIEGEALERHGLSREDFNLREIPHLRLKGSYRRALVEVADLGVEVFDDEYFSGSKKISLEFTLPSGVYATTFLEQFFSYE